MKHLYPPTFFLNTHLLPLTFGLFIVVILILPFQSVAQGGSFCDGSDANAGTIKLDSDFGNPTLLNPDAASGNVNIFKNGSFDALSTEAEITQFEELISSGFNNTGFDQTNTYSCDQTNLNWREIKGVVNGNEPNNDLNGGSSCGATDIIHNGSSSGYGYYTIIDQDCDPTTSGDSYLIVRMRIAKESSGAFGFSLLVDTDNSCNGWIPDIPNSCNNHCFDREIWLGTGGGQTGLHIKDVSGSASPGTEIGVIPISETQVACTSKAVASCKTGNHSTIFYTFAVSFTQLGISSGFFNIGLAPATSNNPDDVIDGNYAFSDVGGVDGSSANASGCSCTGLTGDCLNLCLLSCAAAGNSVVFPVEFLGFDGKHQNNQVTLNWTTARELNNQKFEIERLNAEGEFQSIGEMAGNGTKETVSYYSFEDFNPILGSNFYRLKQIDFDGQFHYSVILEVRAVENDLQLRIAPSVFTDRLDLSIYNYETAPVNIQVFSPTGQLLYAQKQEVVQGSNRVSIATDFMTPGLYFVRLIDAYGNEYPPKKCLKF